ncbi:hypothetical protein AM228_14205 [Planktothricoides sp. SR001]|nr:hypothetical protein AM228_14205 [Planktothricoides sp. SR001]
MHYMGEAKRRKNLDPNFGKDASDANCRQKLKIKVVEIGRSGCPEYIFLSPNELSELKEIVLTTLAFNFIPTDPQLVEGVLEASLACNYWRSDRSFEDAVEQVIDDMRRAMERR